MCKYFNRRFCKYKFMCRFVHPNKICIIYLKNQTCNEKSCSDRHPKLCKWTKSSGGCKREDCDYLHSFGEETFKDTPNMDAPKDCKCEGCKYTWEDKSCVVEHFVEVTLMVEKSTALHFPVFNSDGCSSDFC